MPGYLGLPSLRPSHFCCSARGITMASECRVPSEEGTEGLGGHCSQPGGMLWVLTWQE